MAYSYTLTPKDIYGVEEPEVPKGYKITGFRLPKVGETILTVRLKMAGYLEVPDNVPLGPRLILEKLPEKRLLTKEIAACKQCPHFVILAYELEYRCDNNATKPILVNMNTIPEWCPLPKAP